MGILLDYLSVIKKKTKDNDMKTVVGVEWYFLKGILKSPI